MGRTCLGSPSSGRGLLVSLAIVISLALASMGCGGSAGNTNIVPSSGGAGTSQNTATLVGTVAGSQIYAIADSGASYFVDANPDGSFSLSFPIPGSYRFYLVENGHVASLYVGAGNVFVINSSVGTINVGALNIVNGQCVATNSPLAVAGVTSGGENYFLPEAFLTPPVAGLTVDQMIARGMDSFRNGAFVTARGYFQSAANTGHSSSQGDTINFFLGMSRVAALGFEIQPVSGSVGLTRLSDFLDRAGFSPNNRSSFNQLVLPAVWLGTAPAGDDVRTFVRGRMTDEVEAAFQNFSSISTSFTLYFVYGKGRTLYADASDVAFLKGLMQALKATLKITSSYNLGGSTATFFNNPAPTIQSFIALNTNFMNIADSLLFASAQTDLYNAIASEAAAIRLIRQRTDGQNHLITLSVSPAVADKWLANYPTYQAALSAQQVVGGAGATGALALQNFFANPSVGLRQFLPPFVANRQSGLFTGTPFGTVYGGYTASSAADPNKRTNLANPVPDWIQKVDFHPHIRL